MEFRLIYLLVLLPSQSMSYRKYSLDELCPPEKGYIEKIFHNHDTTTIDIHDSPSMSSVLLDHVWNNSSYRHIHDCEFTIKTRSQSASSGLYVAIRELRFRQKESGECLDYVIFESNSITSQKMCGAVIREKSMREMKNYFEIPDGFLKIIIHIGRDDVAASEISMKLTFTEYQDCNGAFKFHCTKTKCIAASLYDDSIINCAPPLCADEPRFYSKCATRPTYVPENRHILAISSAILLVLFSVPMAWYFLKIYVKWNRYVRDRLINQQRVELELNPVVDHRCRFRTSVVPPVTDDTIQNETIENVTIENDTIDEGSQSNADDPPSYDSLFQ